MSALRRFGFFVWVCLLMAGGLSVQSTQSAEPVPNVVVILADDQGWGDLSVHGNGNLQTPRIDSLAETGVRFDRFYVCPVCAPTRAEFLTGRYHPRGGVFGMTRGEERLNLDESTIADSFRAAGYQTAAFGKWHNGMQYPYHPCGRGFEEFYGFCSGHWGNYFDPMLEHNGEIVRGTGFIIDDLTNHALEFIEQNQNRPFFCYLPYNTPHSPMQVPDRFYEKFREATLKQTHRDPEKEDVPTTLAALAMCENIDWNVGRVLDKLQELQLADRTIVIYFSDNGPNSWRWNQGMKGRKGSTDEGGVRVPCLVRWPGHVAAGKTVSQLAGAIDLFPTLAEFTGVRPVGTKAWDGISLVPFLTNPDTPRVDRKIFTHYHGEVSLRTDQYRLDSKGALFDMNEDPEQRQDVSTAQPAVAEELRNDVAAWKAELLPGLTESDRPFTVGYPEFPITQLPARDGIAHGGIRRSRSAPNCSYFTNWTSVDDRITWEIAVANPGRYRATVFYACAEENVGSVVELSFQGNRIQTRITAPHDPPLYGAEYDRVPRKGESYVKDFKPLVMGEFSLEEGRGELALAAKDIPGSEVMEVRLLLLELLP